MTKPDPNKHHPRCVRLTDAQWKAMQRFGGPDWLRKTINQRLVREEKRNG